MSSHHRRRRKKQGTAETFDINVTPLIDMFSVLISFLMMSAVFAATGQHRVEIPFFSSKPPPTQEELDKKMERMVTVIVDNDKVVMETSFTNSSKGLRKDEFGTDEKGLDDLQAKLYAVRQEDAKFDKVTLMTETDARYEVLVKVIDALRELKPGRQPLPWPPEYKLPFGIDANALVPKIVLGNVIL